MTGKEIEPSELRKLITYDPISGDFRWLATRRGRGGGAGQIAGAVSRGRRTICINRRFYMAPRVAFALMTGKWPGEKLVDHINGNVGDDRWCNLRLADHSQNAANSSGTVGYSWDKSRKTYNARIRVKRKMINLGRFETPEKARAAYASAALKYFGEFARINL